jgi:hypothetical protein
MKQDTNARTRLGGRHLGASSSGQKVIRIPLRAADAKRSVQNILQWNCYLPADCVKTMVRMGWDYTT